MYDNIGGKIKGLAVTIAVLEAFIAVIAGILVMRIDEDMIALGMVIMFAGGLLAWISSFLLYGYGELIEKTCDIAKAVTKNDNFSEPISYNSNVSKSFIGGGAMNIPKQN